METLEQLSQKVQQVFNAYGSKLGIDLPYRKLTESYRLNCYYNTTALLIVKNPHFYLSTEPVPKLDNWRDRERMTNSGELRHCTPNKNGVFDYCVKKQFSSLQEWYSNVQKDASADWKAILRWGSRTHTEKTTDVELSVEQLNAELDKALTKIVYTPAADSFDVLLKDLKLNHAMKSWKAMFFDKETKVWICCSIHNNKLELWKWNPNVPRYTLQYTNIINGSIENKSADTLSELGLEEHEVFIQTYWNGQKYMSIPHMREVFA